MENESSLQYIKEEIDGKWPKVVHDIFSYSNSPQIISLCNIGLYAKSCYLSMGVQHPLKRCKLHLGLDGWFCIHWMLLLLFCRDLVAMVRVGSPLSGAMDVRVRVQREERVIKR